MGRGEQEQDVTGRPSPRPHCTCNLQGPGSPGTVRKCFTHICQAQTEAKPSPLSLLHSVSKLIKQLFILLREETWKDLSHLLQGSSPLPMQGSLKTILIGPRLPKTSLHTAARASAEPVSHRRLALVPILPESTGGRSSQMSGRHRVG